MALATPRDPASVRLAVAGLGRIAEIQRDALAAQTNFVWVGACDPDSSRKAAVCPATVPFFTSLTECLAATACDAVLLSTPSETHFALAAEVLAAGRHLLLEKPAGVRPGEVATLHRQARAAGRQFQTAFHMSRSAEVDWLAAHLIELCGRKADLPLTGFECRFHDFLWADGALHPRAASVLGSWVDSGINALSVLARFFPAETLQVEETAFHRVPGLPVRDVAARVVLTGAGRRGTILTDWTKHNSDKTTVLYFADGRQWLLDHNAQTATLTGPGGTTEHACARHPDRMVDHYRGVFEDFAVSLATGESNAEASVTLHRLLMEAETAAGS